MTKKLIIAIVAGIVFPLYAIAGQPSAQITHGPYLQNLSEDEVTVVWATDKPCKSWVEFSKRKPGKVSTPNRHEKPMPHKTVYIVSTRCTG